MSKDLSAFSKIPMDAYKDPHKCLKILMDVYKDSQAFKVSAPWTTLACALGFE